MFTLLELVFWIYKDNISATFCENLETLRAQRSAAEGRRQKLLAHKIASKAAKVAKELKLLRRLCGFSFAFLAVKSFDGVEIDIPGSGKNLNRGDGRYKAASGAHARMRLTVGSFSWNSHDPRALRLRALPRGFVCR